MLCDDSVPGRLRAAAILALALAAPSAAARRTVTVWNEDAPFSADPAEFDAGAHHLVFTPVEAWVVAGYRPGGGYHGELAERWTVSPDSKTWTFFLRPGMTYENGEPVKAEDLVESWTRLVRVYKAKGSRVDAFAGLLGVDDFPGKADRIAGMSHDERSVTLRFSKPHPGLLGDLSFGFYALAHPSLYDHRTGRWLDPKKAIASGPYKVREWTDGRVLLALRDDYPAALRHPRPFETIEVRWDVESLKRSDLIWGSSESSKASQGLVFQGGEAPGVGFLRVESWKDPSSPFHDAGLRRALRAAFYEELVKTSPVPVDKSFYPLDMKGIRDPSGPPPPAVRAPRGAVLRFVPPAPPYSPLESAVVGSVKAAAERLGFAYAEVAVPFPEISESWTSTSPARRWDIDWMGTRVDTEDPIGELRFMIETTQGVCLPDPTGRARAALKRAGARAQEFNEIFWDDALIWTIRHWHGGWWRKPDIDFSLFDSRNAVPALSMMGWAEGTGRGSPK